MSSRYAVGMVLALVGVVIFSGTVPATRIAVESLDAYFVTAARAAIAGLIAAVVLICLRRRPPQIAQLRVMAVCALCFVVGFSGLVALALRTVPATHSGVVLGIMPLMTAAAAAIILGERRPTRFWLFAVLGAAVVVAFVLRGGGHTLGYGDIFLVLGALTGAIGHVYSGRLSREMPGWEVISWKLVISLPATVPAALWLMPESLAAVPASAWTSLGYLAVFSMYVGFFAWNAGLALAGVANASQTQLLQTFLTIGLAAFINGEGVDLVTVAAAVAVVVMVALGQSARSR